jgi:hypothetical protein
MGHERTLKAARRPTFAHDLAGANRTFAGRSAGAACHEYRLAVRDEVVNE